MQTLHVISDFINIKYHKVDNKEKKIIDGDFVHEDSRAILIYSVTTLLIYAKI